MESACFRDPTSGLMICEPLERGRWAISHHHPSLAAIQVTSIPAFCIAAAIGVKEISGWLAGQPVGADDVIDRP
jgi:hypothetical protein